MPTGLGLLAVAVVAWGGQCHVEAEEREVVPKVNPCGGLLVDVILRLVGARGHLKFHHIDQALLQSM